MALSETVFTEKMDKLNKTQESIENTSTWCSLWRSDARSIVAWWESYFTKADQAKRLCMIYLANDVLQTSRKQGPEFVVEFFKILPRALRHFLAKADDKSKASVNKVVKVWEERRVFGSAKTKTLQELIEESEPTGGNISGGDASTKSHHSNKRARSGTAGAEETGGKAIPELLAPLMRVATEVEAAAARSAELKRLADAIQIPQDTYLPPGEAATARETLENYLKALELEAQQRETARANLQEAANAQANASTQAQALIKAPQAKLEALEKLQESAPAALSAQPVAGPGGVEATVDAAEAAALAAQLMQNPQALLDAIAATMSQGVSQGQGQEGGGVGGMSGGAAMVDDEYDPEDF